MRRAGDRVRITVQLSDVSDGVPAVVRAIRPRAARTSSTSRTRSRRRSPSGCGSRWRTTADRWRGLSKATTNVDAYQLYLQGRALLDRRGASTPMALEHFQQAVELDPGYALAWAGIADAHGAGLLWRREGRERAAARHRRGPQGDHARPELGRSPYGPGLRPAVLPRRSRAGRSASSSALELNPHYVQGRCWYALFMCSGPTAESRKAWRKHAARWRAIRCHRTP